MRPKTLVIIGIIEALLVCLCLYAVVSEPSSDIPSMGNSQAEIQQADSVHVEK